MTRWVKGDRCSLRSVFLVVAALVRIIIRFGTFCLFLLLLRVLGVLGRPFSLVFFWSWRDLGSACGFFNHDLSLISSRIVLSWIFADNSHLVCHLSLIHSRLVELLNLLTQLLGVSCHSVDGLFRRIICSRCLFLNFSYSSLEFWDRLLQFVCAFFELWEFAQPLILLFAAFFSDHGGDAITDLFSDGS